MYGRCRGYEVPFLNEFHLMRKMQLAKESMDVLNITEPGIGTIKGSIGKEFKVHFICLKEVHFRDGGVRNAPPLHHAVADVRSDRKDQPGSVGKGL